MATANRAGVAIGRARLAGARTGDRERLAAALDRVRPAAIDLPPRATLILRRFAAPRPLAREGTLDGFVGSIEERLRERLAAARRGVSPEDRYFEDEDAIELALVHLALAPAGPPPAWTVLLPGGSEPMARWRRTILPAPARLARMLARLEQAGLAAAWLARFDPAEIVSAEERLLAAYGCPPLRAPPKGQGPAPARPRAPAVLRLAASLRRLQPEATPPGAAPAVARLLVAALVAERRPALLTAPGFTDAIALLAITPASRDTARSSVSPQPVPDDRMARPAPRRAISSEGTPLRPAMADAHPIAVREEGALQPPLPLPSPPTHPTAPEPAGIAEIETGFGGMFFLLNVFVALDLWGDFTRPRDAQPGLSPFELIAMLGRCWYGRAFAGDPIDAACRTLAGLAPRERPGAHFAAPAWSVPRQWLAPWPRARAVPHGANRWHPAGFPWRDAPRARSAAGQRRRWTWALSRYLAARLAAAIGEGDARAARDLVCRRPARLAIEPERLTVRFALEEHPIALRLAGLDRDPGRLAGTAAACRFEFDA